jgi:uncharacterized protein
VSSSRNERPSASVLNGVSDSETTCDAALAAASGAEPSPSVSKRAKRQRTWRRIFVEYFVLIFVLYAGGCLALAWNTVRPKLGRHSATPAGYRLTFESVSFRSADGTRLSGWWIPAKGAPKGVVILCHGVDSTMKDMRWKAAAFNRHGFSTLVFDFRGRGESDGALCTIGYRETDDLLAAVKYVRGRDDAKDLPLGVFGESQGAAVALMGTARCPDIRAVVAESPFARLDHAVENHFRSVFGVTGALTSKPVRWIGEAMIRRRCCDVSPMDEVSKIAPRPLMIIQDEDDILCPKEETETLMKAAGEPKELWSVPNAGHVRAEDVAPEEFERRVSQFFVKNLKR